ncbi:MAG: Holliday junction branch migration DNA helicase RuvB [Planctomycetota bacterium]
MSLHRGPLPGEVEFDRALRPASLDEFIGQTRVRENLRVAIAAALGRAEPLDHLIFAGPPGLGKTTLAHLIASAMGTNLTVTSGPALASPRDMAGMLTRQERGDVLFIDEIHRVPRAVEEYLYTAMEDHAIDLVIDADGPASRSVRLTLAPFTLVGATTREGLLSSPLRSRFGIIERLETYPDADIAQILERAAGKLGVQVTKPAVGLLAARSRGVPRLALRLQRRARDLAQVLEKGAIDEGIVRDCLERLGIDDLGLEETDRRILRALVQRREPTGLKMLAAMIDESEDTIEEVFEPHLIRRGLVVRTPRGRIATAEAFRHLGLPGEKGTLFG